MHQKLDGTSTRIERGRVKPAVRDGGSRAVFFRANPWAIGARLAAVALMALSARAQVEVLTANYDNSRTNSNLHETKLSPKTVGPATFGKIGTFPVDGQIYAQPLYVSGIQIAGAGQRNV